MSESRPLSPQEPSPQEILAQAASSWEERYASSQRTWSGNPNAALVANVQDLSPGKSLDIGCGEGADVLWLAQQGWHAHGLDLSPTAIARARAAADDAGVPNVELFSGDVVSWSADFAEAFDLVTAMFLHVYDGQDRREIFEVVADMVAPGGRVLLVSHAVAPPWSQRRQQGHGHDHPVITPEDDLKLLGTRYRWEVEVAEILEREGTGPGGVTGMLQDSVLLVKKA